MTKPGALVAQLPDPRPVRSAVLNPVVVDPADLGDDLWQQWSFLNDVLAIDAETQCAVGQAFERRDYDRVAAMLRPFFRLVVVINTIARRRWLAIVQWFDDAGRATDIDCFEAVGHSADDAAADLTRRLSEAYQPGWEIVRLTPVAGEGE